VTGPPHPGRRPLPPARLIPGGGRRAPTPRDATRAAYRAHTSDTHQGKVGRGCRTCASYLTTLARYLTEPTR
jgi:hypothetical protein